jgi:hypothetical protein
MLFIFYMCSKQACAIIVVRSKLPFMKVEEGEGEGNTYLACIMTYGL